MSFNLAAFRGGNGEFNRGGRGGGGELDEAARASKPGRRGGGGKGPAVEWMPG